MKKHEKNLIAEWKFKLATNRDWAIRGLMAIYARQTEWEKAAETVAQQNGMGFASTDGNILSSFAKFYQDKGFLSRKQMDHVFKRMPKYAGQLLIVAKAKGTVK